MNFPIKKNHNSYKIGMEEIEGLERAMRSAFQPIVDSIADRVYWYDKDSLVSRAEYKSRDGFIPYADNHGGLELNAVIPKCEEYDFSFLEFGECDDKECKCHKEGSNGSCSYEDEGHFDSKLRIFFKFEGIEDDKLKFYLVMSGGNNDAPYYREKYMPTLLEASFESSSLFGIKRAADKHVNKLLKIIK